MYIMKEMEFIILLLFLLSPLNHNANKLEVKFCGNKQTCSTNITKQGFLDDGCCRPCECDDICSEKGTCCRDKTERLDMDLQTKQKCHSSAYLPNNVSEPKRILSYYQRVSCPKVFNDTDIKSKCEEDKIKTIAGIKPVSSRDGKIVYKNKYCSYCHGERNIKSWTITVHRASPVSCHEILVQENWNIATITTRILSNCILHFIPPKNIDLFKVLCFDKNRVKKKCNKTGKWEVFDKTINSLCLNNRESGYYIFRDLKYVYQNVYCAMCNEPYYESVEVCKNSIGRFPPNRPLFTLINVNKLLDGRQTNRCGYGEILDTFFNTCRTLYCLWNSFSFKGKCVPFIDYSTKLGYKLVVKLESTENITHSDLTESKIRSIYTPFLEKLKFVDCEICNLVVYAEKYSHEMYVNCTLTPNVRCKIENIWLKFMRAETILPFSFNVTVNDKQFVLTAFWNFPTPYKDYKVYLIDGTRGYCQGFAPARGQICPKVNLLKHEAERVQKYHPNTEKLKWVQNEKDINGSIFVCTDDYIFYQNYSSTIKCQTYYFLFVSIIIFILSQG